MARHIIDRPNISSGKGMRQAFLTIDRRNRTHPELRKLAQQSSHTSGITRLRQFLRIARTRVS